MITWKNITKTNERFTSMSLKISAMELLGKIVA
jgi:hypothetical protein